VEFVGKIIEYSRLNEKIYHHSTKSGLNIYVLPRREYFKKYAVYATNYGSKDNEFLLPGKKKPVKVPEGIAHFLEHKMFEEENGNAFDKFSRWGGQANAFTNFTTTAYLFYSTQNFYENLDILLSFVNHPYLTEENIEKEKGIIGQEIRMYEDNPESQVFFNVLRALFHCHPVRNDIAGTIESIAKIDKPTLMQCYHAFYQPQNMLLFVAGSVEPDRVFQQVEKFWNGMSISRKENTKRIKVREPSHINKSEIKERLDVSIPLFALGFKDNQIGIKGAELLHKTVVTEICLELLAGKASKLYDHLYEEGLIDLNFHISYTGEEDYGYSLISGESPKPEKVRSHVFHALENIKSGGISEKDFIRVKRKLTGDFIQRLDSLESVAHSFVDNVFKGISLFDRLKVLEGISVEEIIARFEDHFCHDNASLSIILPNR
jgi:predicted Zn-dependent peptidase